MYVRVTPSHSDPARAEEVVRFAEERLVPALRRLPGFRRYTVGVDRATGDGIAFTEWDTLEQAQNLRPALGGLTQEIADHGIRLETSRVYEVRVQA
jgi:hypothetical protein